MNDSSEGSSAVVTCYRHADKRAGVICQRCDRPICGHCMSAASVGFHCPECLAKATQKVVFGPPAFSPVLTKALLGVIAAVFVAQVALSNSFIVDFALWGPAVARGEWYRVFTAAFIHDGYFHVGFNCFALWIMGRQLERFFGRTRFGLLFLLSVLGGSLGVLLLTPNAAAVGASGGIFGLFGAMAIAQRALGMSIWANGLGPVLAINLALTFVVATISVGGHLGGLLFGGIVGYLYVSLKSAGKKDWIAIALAGCLGLLLFVLALSLAYLPFP